MRDRNALLVSVVVHVAVIAVLVRGVPDISLTELDRPPIPQRAVAPPPDEEIAVTIVRVPDPVPLPPTTAPTTAPTAPPPAPRGDAPEGQVATEPSTRARPSTETSTVEPGPPSDVAPGPGSSMMRMRGPDLALDESGEAMTSFMAKPAIPRAAAPRESGRLEQRGREHVVRDTVTTMRVHEDGHVTFDDAGDVDFHKETAATPENMPEGADPNHEQAVGGPEGAGGRNSAMAPGAGMVGGKLDVTGYAMRKLGMDPHASRKLKMLDDTREERVAIGKAHTTQQLGRSSELMHRNVQQVWRATADPAARREALFALWDECDEGTSERGVAGQRARAIVIGWIRTHLPASGADAFTPAEITALDQRRTSKQHFAPY